MQALTATRARSNLFGLIKDATQKNILFQIHHPSGNAVLMSEDEYLSLIETLELLSSPHFRKKFKKARKQVEMGELVPMAEIFKK